MNNQYIYNEINDLFKIIINDDNLLKCVVQLFNTKNLCRDYNICNDDSTVDWKHDRELGSTNPLFPNFFHKIFHAGTKEQFYNYVESIEIKNSINCTFNYIFDYFKKGIFVSIKNNIIKIYLPFTNTNYTNDWGQNLKLDPKLSFLGKNIYEAQLKIFRDYETNPNFQTTINPNLNQWYANNHFFRNTIYKNGILKNLDDEGDKSVAVFLELLTVLCIKRSINDVHFFINPRDYPILKKNFDHPYDLLYQIVPNFKNHFINQTPILSQSITDDYADILIPNEDDIKYILCKEYFNNYELNWSQKKSLGVFRGSATGFGVDSNDNQRLKLIKISEKFPNFIDAQLTSLNNKLKVNPKTKYIQLIDKKKYKIGNKLSPYEQSQYKYIIHVQGHVSAFRLTRELSYNSLILFIENPWKIWYQDLLIPFNPFNQLKNNINNAHYILIDYSMDNLINTINWCINNDNICQQIANRAYDFWKKHFNNDIFLLNYTQKILNSFTTDTDINILINNYFENNSKIKLFETLKNKIYVYTDDDNNIYFFNELLPDIISNIYKNKSLHDIEEILNNIDYTKISIYNWSTKNVDIESIIKNIQQYFNYTKKNKCLTINYDNKTIELYGYNKKQLIKIYDKMILTPNPNHKKIINEQKKILFNN